MSEPILKFENINIGFPTASGEANVVNDVSFTVLKGRCLVILGESGSGKSMCCQAILGLVPAPGRVYGGAIRWLGRNLLHAKESDWNSIRGSEIAMVFQDSAAT